MARIAPFPHRYTISLSDGLVTAPSRPPIPVGPPPQFGGTETVWSPEDLLVAATLECLWTTFNAYVRHEGIHADLAGTATGVLDKGPTGPRFTSIDLDVRLVAAATDLEKARSLLLKAEKNCIISNALSAPVHLNVSIQEH